MRSVTYDVENSSFLPVCTLFSPAELYNQPSQFLNFRILPFNCVKHSITARWIRHRLSSKIDAACREYYAQEGPRERRPHLQLSKEWLSSIRVDFEYFGSSSTQ